MSDHLLYGFDGDEFLDDDPADTYERWIEWQDEVERGPDTPPLHISEWSSKSLAHLLPSVDRLIEWANEHASEDACWEEAGEALDRTAADPDVVAAFAAAVDVWSRKLEPEFRVADEHLRTVIVTWGADGEPVYTFGPPK